MAVNRKCEQVEPFCMYCFFYSEGLCTNFEYSNMYEVREEDSCWFWEDEHVE